MKKLYRKGTVHPTPPAVSDQLLSFLPAAIVALAVALSPEEREVLAYLISCSSGGAKGGGACDHRHPHEPCFQCYCFRCYTSYWAKWDSSPNRQLIHEIIDAFEDNLVKEKSSYKKEKGTKKERRKGKIVKGNVVVSSIEVLDDVKKGSELNLKQEDSNSAAESGSFAAGKVSDGDEDSGDDVDFDKGSVRRFVSFIGDRIWSVFGGEKNEN